MRLRPADGAVAATPVGFDALHGSEAQIRRALVLARLRDPQAAAELGAVFSSPSAFRPDLLRHDPGVWGWWRGRRPAASTMRTRQRVLRVRAR